MENKPWWYPTLATPEQAEETGRKYYDVHDHLGDARDQLEALSDAFFVEREKVRKLRETVSNLREIRHSECEDSWYSCPKSEEGCSDKRQGNECNCGLEKKNAIINQVLAETADKAG